MGKAVTTGFGQVSKDKKTSDYFFKGADLSSEIVKELTELCTDENIPISATSESFITASTESPFSEKLMLFHVVMMSSQRISMKGMALADSARADLNVKYIKLMRKTLKYESEGASILIDNRWLEQPPQAINHEHLVGV